jgi:ferrochelatase
MKKGLLLINLGTPDHATRRAVWRYLRVFLMDKRVVTLPRWLRYALVYMLVLPFRIKASTHAYREIWTKQGSPLLVNSQQFLMRMQVLLNDSHHVVLGMRYGNPSIAHALTQLKHCEHITILPLFPQYSSAATGSAMSAAMRHMLDWPLLPSLRIIRDFHDYPEFIQAQAARIRPYLEGHDHLLLSYHGIPERHLTSTCCSRLCESACPSTSMMKSACYRAQCYETTRLLADTLHLDDSQYSIAFQSRLGRTPWLKPYTDEILISLMQQGVRRLVIVCPSFVADCLETLEEIGMRAKEQWHRLGGEVCTMIPCLNDDALFVDAMVKLISKE